MARRRLNLGSSKVAAIIDKKYASEPDGWRKTRLLAIKLAARGEHSAAEIAELCAISRGHLFEWLKLLRQDGLEALLQRGRPGPKEGALRGLKQKVLEELRAKLGAGDFVTVVHAQRWLKDTHKIERPYKTVWRWLKKLGGVLRVPRPSHSKKDPEAADRFRNELAERLEALGIEPGSSVKLWIMDEARFGLHTELRRVWIPKGKRPVKKRQIKYEWDYLYGSLDLVGGAAHFCQLPGVNLHWDQKYLEDLVGSAPEAIHVVIRDQAGFHLRDGDARLPAKVRIIDLPPYSPELNACEQLWDILKDDIGNRIFDTIAALRDAMIPTLQRYWDDATQVLRLIGRPWLLAQANSSHRTQESG